MTRALTRERLALMAVIFVFVWPIATLLGFLSRSVLPQEPLALQTLITALVLVPTMVLAVVPVSARIARRIAGPRPAAASVATEAD